MSNKMFMPAGEYWIGDPCYIFPDKGPMEDKWDELLDEVDFSKTSYGELDDGKIKVWAAPTAHGSGVYLTSNNKMIYVDNGLNGAGLIGIVPLKTIEYLNRTDIILDKLGLFIEFKWSFEVMSKNGFFRFGNIAIDTENYDDSLYDEEYEYDDE
jgi:hypothetical protein